MNMLIGTSGWSYRDWRGVFYPEKLPQRQWLGYFAEQFPTVELNNAFYRLPSHDNFVGWREQINQTGDRMIVAVKASRYLTHLKRLTDPVEPVTRLIEHARGLGDHLGPILLQLPPNFPPAPDRLDQCLRSFPSDIRVTVEPRDERWFCDEIRAVLERHQVPLCWGDRLGRPVGPLWRTADWGYLRMHEGHARPYPRYGRQALTSWLRRVERTYQRGEDVFVYFNNDTDGAAVLDAQAMVGLQNR